MNSKITKNNKGFTLIEVMIATAIFGLVIVLIINAFRQQDSQNVSQNQVTEIQQNVRAGFHMIISEIRMAGFDPDGSYGTGITAAGTGAAGSPLTFTYIARNDCVDNDGDAGIPDPPCGNVNVDEEGEIKTVTINLFSSSIDGGGSIDEVQIDAAGQPIAENISTLLFTYFDSNGTQIFPSASATPAELATIKAVNVQLTAGPEESERNLLTNKGGGNRTLESLIKCRNL